MILNLSFKLAFIATLHKNIIFLIFVTSIAPLLFNHARPKIINKVTLLVTE